MRPHSLLTRERRTPIVARRGNLLAGEAIVLEQWVGLRPEVVVGARCVSLTLIIYPKASSSYGAHRQQPGEVLTRRHGIGLKTEGFTRFGDGLVDLSLQTKGD